MQLSVKSTTRCVQQVLQAKKPVQHLEDRMRAAGPSGAHAIENLECLPEPKLQLQLGASRMLKRRLSNRHVPGLQQESSS